MDYGQKENANQARTAQSTHPAVSIHRPGCDRHPFDGDFINREMITRQVRDSGEFHAPVAPDRREDCR